MHSVRIAAEPHVWVSGRRETRQAADGTSPQTLRCSCRRDRDRWNEEDPDAELALFGAGEHNW